MVCTKTNPSTDSTTDACFEDKLWLEMLRDIVELRHLKIDARDSDELARLLGEANQLVAITVASRKTARGEQ